MKLFLGFFFALLISAHFFPPVTAFAGDFSTREIIGFSSDGNTFAFEEYGIQDGSGFAYSTIYAIDTRTDEWLPGSPFKVQSDDEIISLDDIRTKSKTAAANILATITEPGTLNATNQPLEVVDNPLRMTARPWHFTPPTSERIEFRIEPIAMQGQSYCADFGQVFGFRLTRTAMKVGETTTLLHEDKQIPKSRGCPLRYRFADIVTHRVEQTGDLATAILVLYETVGFEGPDGRYLAVTTRLPAN